MGGRESYMWAMGGVLIHDGTVAEVLNETLLSLESGVGHLKDLVSREARHWLALPGAEEAQHVCWRGEVDEGVADIVAGPEVRTEIDEREAAEARCAQHVNDMF